MATARPTTEPSNIPGLRARALQNIFPNMPTPAGTPANSPVPINPADRTRAQAPLQQSAASRASQAVAAHLAANPVKPVAAPVKSTRANSQQAQSAGTINTNYGNSATAQGYSGVTPPDIFRGARAGRSFGPTRYNELGMALPFTGLHAAGQAPTHNREFFRNQVFVPSPAQQRANLFSFQTPAASSILGQPLSPQVGVPVQTFPPRNQFLNYLFPR